MAMKLSGFLRFRHRGKFEERHINHKAHKESVSGLRNKTILSHLGERIVLFFVIFVIFACFVVKAFCDPEREN